MCSMDVVDAGRRGWIWRLALSGACLVAGVVALSSRFAAPLYDLQVIAPDEALPGHFMPVRAVLLRVKDQGLPQVEGHGATLALLAADGETKLAASMRRSACDDAEGGLSISPTLPSGNYTLRVRARAHDGTLLQTSKPLRITPHAKGLLSHPRWAHATQHGRMDRVHWHQRERTKTALEVAVEQGSCLPEYPCTLLIHSSLHGVSASLMNLHGAKNLSEHAVLLSSGYAALRLLVQGPMARATVLLSRGATPVVSRALELPVALGQPPLFVTDRLLAAPKPPLMHLSAAPCIIIDAFELRGEQEHWRRSQARPTHAINEVPWQPGWLPLNQGLWRLQARTSRFDTRSARSAIISVGSGILHANSMNLTAAQPAFAFENAKRESAHVVLPEPARSLPAQRAASQKRQAQVRAAVAVMAGLVGLALLVMFLLGGMRAQRQADGLWATLGIPPADLHRQHRWLNVVALALLACAAGVGTFILLWIYLAMP